MRTRTAIFPTVWLGLVFLGLAGSKTTAFGQDTGPVSGTPLQPAQARVEQSPSTFVIKPSEVAVPKGLSPGQYRRIVTPYPNWTLICDEDLKAKKRICNISQQIVDADGNAVFSWSLAATAQGQPVLILRTPAAVGKGSPVQLAFEGEARPVSVMTDACDAKVCVAMMPLGQNMKTIIGKGKGVEISFPPTARTKERTVIRTTFDGLPSALGAI